MANKKQGKGVGKVQRQLSEEEVDRLVNSLIAAVDGSLAALVQLDRLPDESPPDALDHALANDPTYQFARKGLKVALEEAANVIPEARRNDVLLNLEAAANALSVAASDVAWKLAMTARTQVKQPGKGR